MGMIEPNMSFVPKNGAKVQIFHQIEAIIDKNIKILCLSPIKFLYNFSPCNYTFRHFLRQNTKRISKKK